MIAKFRRKNLFLIPALLFVVSLFCWSLKPLIPVSRTAGQDSTQRQVSPKAAPRYTPEQAEQGDWNPMTTSRAAQLSSRIVWASCTSVSVRKDNGGNIFTFSEFRVIRTIKGNLARHFTLRLLGGRIGDEEVNDSGIPKFTPKEQAVLFLGDDNQEGYPTIFPQAIFRIQPDNTSGQQVVNPSPTDLALYRAADGSRYTSAPTSLSLDDFIYSLTRFVTENHRRNEK